MEARFLICVLLHSARLFLPNVNVEAYLNKYGVLDLLITSPSLDCYDLSEYEYDGRALLFTDLLLSGLEENVRKIQKDGGGRVESLTLSVVGCDIQEYKSIKEASIRLIKNEVTYRRITDALEKLSVNKYDHPIVSFLFGGEDSPLREPGGISFHFDMNEF